MQLSHGSLISMEWTAKSNLQHRNTGILTFNSLFESWKGFRRWYGV